MSIDSMILGSKTFVWIIFSYINIFNKILILWCSFMLLSFFSVIQVFASDASCTWFGCSDWQQDEELKLNIGAWWEWEVDVWLEDIIQQWINTFLSMMWLIALAVLIRWGLKMLTASGNEERFNSWFKYLKNAFIGLFIIGLSRFIVTFIFWATSLITADAWWDVWYVVLHQA